MAKSGEKAVHRTGEGYRQMVFRVYTGRSFREAEDTRQGNRFIDLAN
jgi:hypothetical protein